MPRKLQIAIPKPCHENWQDMMPTEKGRFCASCQKEVQDFTRLTDREVSAIIKRDSNSCGRFLTSQVNRDIIVHKEKSSLWVAASAAVISFIGLGNYEAAAQESHPTEQHESEKSENAATNKSYRESTEITGIVTDADGLPIPYAKVRNLNESTIVQTDFEGVFTIAAKKGDILEFTYTGMKIKKVTVTKMNKYNIQLNDGYESSDDDNIEYVITGGYAPRTFFGRIFHSIGNVFRRN